jgi:phosphopantothenoylcysteine synthetase/decarboxylase
VSNLSLVVCGAPLASRAADIAAALGDAGWTVTVLPTDAATAWHDDIRGTSAHAAQLRRPDEPKPPRPDAVVVCPMTFNTGNKWAHGIADSQPLSVLAEALGAGIPAVAVPFVNQSLAGHPAWSESLVRLSSAGVRLVDPDPDRPGPLRSGTGDEVTARFDPARVVAALGS